VQRFVPALFAMFMLATPAASMASTMTPLSTVVDDALAAGADAVLPPALAVPLGLSRNAEGTPVRQITGQGARLTHRFCVSTSHRHEIVMLTEDASSHITTAYLLSVAGKLRKAVIQPGEGAAATIPRARATIEFTAERDYWASAARPRPAGR